MARTLLHKSHAAPYGRKCHPWFNEIPNAIPLRHGFIYLAVHHLFVQFIQPVHDGVVLLVQFTHADGIFALPTERKHQAHLEQLPTDIYRLIGPEV
jgi:hypothetical protein